MISDPLLLGCCQVNDTEFAVDFPLMITTGSGHAGGVANVKTGLKTITNTW